MTLNILHPVLDKKGETPNFASQPYDLKIEHTLSLKEFGRINLRPIRIEDENEMVDFHLKLSEESIYLRYFEHITLDTRTLHERLARICTNTDESFAIVAETPANGHLPAQIIGVGRLTTTETPGKAAFAMIVAGVALETHLPRELLKHLLTIARAYRFRTVTGELLVADHDMLNLCRSLGFRLHTVPDEGIVRVHFGL